LECGFTFFWGEVRFERIEGGFSQLYLMFGVTVTIAVVEMLYGWKNLCGDSGRGGDWF